MSEKGFFKKHFSKEALKLFFKKQWITIKNEFTSEPLPEFIKNNLYILLGAVVYALGCSFFLLPMNIISGGITSIAIIFSSIPGLDVLPVNTYIYILSWGFFIIGLFILGLKYSLKSLVFVLCYPLFISMFDALIDVCVVDGIKILDITSCFIRDIVLENGLIIESSESLKAIAYIISAVLGGLLIGSGVGLALLGGGSSGGTDVINVSMHKFFHVKIGTSSLCCDVVIIIGGFFANDMNLLASSVGVLGSILCSVMIDRVFMGLSQHYVALIVSNKWYDINKYINEEIERGTTLFRAEGGFSRVDTMVIEVCFDRREYTMIQNIIHRIDPHAFLTVLRAQEILGYGFSRSTPDVMDIPLPPDTTQRLLLKSRQKKDSDQRN